MVWEVEHIFPQRAKEEDWDNKNELIPYLHKLGNLTLTRYNQNLGRKSFKDKCKDEKIELKSGNIKINDYILGVEQWTKNRKKRDEKIVKCQKEITNLLINVLKDKPLK